MSLLGTTLVMASVFAGLQAEAPAPPPIFAVVIGVNKPPDSTTSRLKYADDDAILFHEIFSAAGESTLLANPDKQTRSVFGELEGQPATRAHLRAAISTVLEGVSAAKNAGQKPILYFVYSGHGDVDNGEGYIVLEDGRFFAHELAEELLEKSEAVENHIVIDACYSYYLVQEKSVGGTRKAVSTPFAMRRDLTKRFPNTGFLLSTDANAQSHEWGEFQAGVFSHEVRSGLLGGADLNNDGAVSYDEMLAFAEVANKRVKNERYRQRVFSYPPRSDGASVLFRPAHLLNAGILRVPAKNAGRYSLETAEGVRLADVHTSMDAPVNLRLSRPGRLYLLDRTRSVEYVVEVHRGSDVSVTDIAADDPRSAKKGAAHEAFESIFTLPYSRSNYVTALQAHQANRVFGELSPVDRDAIQDSSHQLALTYSAATGFLEDGGALHSFTLSYRHSEHWHILGAGLRYAYSGYGVPNEIDVDLHLVGAVVSAGVGVSLLEWLRLVPQAEVALSWGFQRARRGASDLSRNHSVVSYRLSFGPEARLGSWSFLLAGFAGQSIHARQDGWHAPLDLGGGLSGILHL